MFLYHQVTQLSQSLSMNTALPFFQLKKRFASVNSEFFLLMFAENEKVLLKGREQEGRETDWLYSITLANATGLLAGI